ncbi:SIMPL domain-containing protein [Porphyrobacter sp. GA68]|uniref:SIMPL domain-containing protein n=1 Tax=Porphyrobacter sp. GA68 TaxID=2883480 RepID=UPI001D185D30|nr:SIMPL domain-containing protein [Porphyrobacter sp. GA68]
MIKKTAYSAALAAAMTLCAGAAAAADVKLVAQNPLVELSVFEEVEAKPDTVTIGAGVVTDAPTAVEALRQNSAAMQRVIDRIKAAGVAERDIQTTGLNLSARYDYDNQQRRQIFLGYQARNTVSVKFRDVQRAGPILDALVAAGANDVNGPSFSIENDEQYKATARRNALQKAQRQAEEYARAAGYTGVRLLLVNEALHGRARAESGAIMVTAARMDAAAPPVEPGVIGTGVQINVTYEMVR